ncbi:MAG: S66 peptidase family protein [Bryobacteraceae bacterium]
MNRRNFLATVAVAPLLAAPPTQRIRPRALRPGDTVGVITPSTYVSDPDELESAARLVKFFDLRLKMGKNVGKRAGYLAGSVAERVSDLHDMFRDPEVKGVFAVRGGYGAAQLLDHIDYGLIRENPKVFLGFSDITALHLSIGKRTGLVTFHGPVATSHLTTWSQNALRKAIFSTQPLGNVANPPEENPLRPSHTLRTVRPGKARGALVGGNLTLMSTTLGTPFEIETRGRILLLEDVEEDIYRIDRMLTHLRLAGKLDGVAGIVFGECQNCPPHGHSSAYSLGEVIDYLLGPLNIPVLFGLSFGHTEDQVTLPLGVMASLDAGARQLVVEEAGVIMAA